MDVNAAFDRRAAVHAATLDWTPSPIAGVARKMLDRVGGELARATSLVRYAPGSAFSPHLHGGGEEFLVLEGVFQDEHGDYPAGSYVRNPPQSRHTPASAAGCTIFVKLWQFAADDRTPLHRGTRDLPLTPQPGRPGVAVGPLHRDAREEVRIERWAPDAEIVCDAPGGLELLVLDGAFTSAGERFAPASWLRLPDGDRLVARAGAEGCRLWLKRGHLRFVAADLAGLQAAATG